MTTRFFIRLLQSCTGWGLLLAILLAAMAFTARAELTDASDVISLQSPHTIDAPVVQLSDVFANLPEGADRPIGPAPAPGQSQKFDVYILARLAQANRLAWRATTMSDSLTISRASTEITPADIEARLLEELRATQPELTGEVSLMLDQRLKSIHLPTDATPSLTFSQWRYDSLARRVQARLEVGAGQPALTLSARVEEMVSIPVAARPLARGEVLSASDLTYINMPAAQAGLLLRDSEQLVGRAMQRYLAEGQPLRRQDVQAPRLVTRGQLVPMQVQTTTMSLATRGLAQQDGALGETIRLLNPTSKRIVLGVVQADGSVRIDTTNPALAGSATTTSVATATPPTF